LAAGILLAVGLGLLAALPRGDVQGATTIARTDGIALKPVAAYGDYRAVLDASELEPVSIETGVWPPDALTGVIRDETIGIPVQIDGETIYVRNRRTLQALEYIRNVEGESRGTRPAPEFGETRTGTQPNSFLASVLKEYVAHGTGFDGLVALRHPPAATSVPATRAAPARTEEASQYVEGADMGTTHYLTVTQQGQPVLTLAGELWIEPIGGGASERVGRSRIVTATTWVKTAELVHMVWASETAADPKAKEFAFRAESLILGPKARQQLLGKNGRDEALIQWLAKTYGSRGVVAAGRAGAARNRNLVSRLVAALEADRQATGFAVYGEDGTLLGTEIFATHELMVQFAARLLRGYLLEAGGRIRLQAASGNATEIATRVHTFLNEEMPRNAQRVVDVRTWRDSDAADWPEGMRLVNVLSPTRQVIGQGLFLGEQLIQMSMFGP
jgi:hypothetical protein